MKINEGLDPLEYLAQCWAFGECLINLSTWFLTLLRAPKPPLGEAGTKTRGSSSLRDFHDVTVLSLVLDPDQMKVALCKALLETVQ